MSRIARPSGPQFWGSDDHGCHILHVDMDCFYASVELLDYPELRGTPVIVGGSADRGVVTSATYEARAAGVHAAMPMAKARRLCPTATILPGRRHLYEQASARIMAQLRDICAVVEQVSIDEAFLDVSGALRAFGSPVTIAKLIRERIATQVGVPASVGVATLTHVAKLASTFAKPDGMLLIAADQTKPFLASLPVGSLPGVGPSARQTLAKHGVETVAEMLGVSHQRLSRWIGAHQALRLRQLAQGRELRGIEVDRQEKSQSKERTFARNITARAEIETELIGQAHALARRLRSHGLVGVTVAIKVRFADFRTITRSRSLTRATDVGAVIAEVAGALLRNVAIPASGVRLVGCRIEGLSKRADGVQLAIGEREKIRKAEATADAIAKRFGTGSISPARLINSEGEG